MESPPAEGASSSARAPGPDPATSAARGRAASDAGSSTSTSTPAPERSGGTRRDARVAIARANRSAAWSDRRDARGRGRRSVGRRRRCSSPGTTMSVEARARARRRAETRATRARAPTSSRARSRDARTSRRRALAWCERLFPRGRWRRVIFGSPTRRRSPRQRKISPSAGGSNNARGGQIGARAHG